MMLPQEFIDEVKNKTDIVDLISEYTNLHKVGDNIWQGRCPHPKHEDEEPSFTVWEKTQTWCCYGCHIGKKNNEDNYGSDCIAFIRWLKNINFTESVIFLAKRLELPLPNDKNMVEYKQNKQLNGIYQKALFKNNDVLNYLYSRNLDIDDIEKWCLGYDGCSIVFPLFDRYKNILGFSRRKFKENKRMQKYKNPPNSDLFKKSKYFYGIHNIDNTCNEIRITEGPFDVILANKYGVKNVVALQGTAFTEDHVKIIKQLKMTPVLCLDGDSAGKNGIIRSIKCMNAFDIKSKVFIMPHNYDLAEFSNIYKYNTEQYINTHTVMYSQYLMHDIMLYYDAKINELKTDMVPRFKKILDHVDNEDEKFVLVNYIQNKTGLNFSDKGDEKNDLFKM